MIPDTSLPLDDDLPYYVCLRSLKQILREYTSETLPNKGEYIAFDVEGFDRLSLFVMIYLHQGSAKPFDFPIAKIDLRGTAVYPENPQDALFPRRNGLHGTGAFRSLITYLESELARRGFKRIFLEHVGNDALRAVIKRYGFVRTGRPKSLNYAKQLTASV